MLTNCWQEFSSSRVVDRVFGPLAGNYSCYSVQTYRT